MTTSHLVEGPSDWDRVDPMVERVVSVPRAVILEREEAYQKQVAATPNKRGPKPKVTSVAPAPGTEPLA